MFLVEYHCGVLATMTKGLLINPISFSMVRAKLKFFRLASYGTTSVQAKQGLGNDSSRRIQPQTTNTLHQSFKQPR